jgi:TIR domain
MADDAHVASGPASPKPGDIAPQQASQPDSPDKGKLRVFISYSRDDLYFADQLDAALNACGFECLIDRHGISGGEEWKRRLGNLIRESDTVVFVLSPTSARSEICDWEVEEATRLGKRILPVVCRPLDGASPPPRLRERNYIFFYDDPKAAPGSGFGSGLAKLIAALNTDFD